MTDAKKYFTAARRQFIESPLKELGFKKYKTVFIGRMTDDGIFQFLNFETSAHGGEQLTVDVAIRPMYCPHESHLTLLPGNRLGAMASDGKHDRWWSYATEEKALASLTEIAGLLHEYALPFFNATTTSDAIIDAYENNTFGDQVRWGSTGWGNNDLAHIYLRAGELETARVQFDAACAKFSVDDREWAQAAARECRNMTALIGTGTAAIEQYIERTIKQSKHNLKWSDR